jgi:ferredoxin-type protein NapH
VFCAICPVGLTFGLLYALIGLFTTHQLTLDLIYFPLLLGLELIVLRSWCRSFCPLGTLLGFIGSRSRLLLPVVDRVQCFASQSIGCQVCAKACPQGIDLKDEDDRILREDCTRCYECADDCPRDAISVPSLPVTAKRRPAGD